MYEPPSDHRVTKTLYLAYVPSVYAATLKPLLQDPTSQFYQTNGSSIEQELVSLVDSTFDPLTYAQSASTQHGMVAPQTRNVLVGSFSGAAGAVLLGVLAWWLRRRRTVRALADAASKRNTMQSFVDCSAPKKDLQVQAAHLSHSYFAGDQEGTPSVSAFESPCGVTGTIGMRHPLPAWSPVPVMRPSRTPSSFHHDPSPYPCRSEPRHEAADSHDQLMPYTDYMDRHDAMPWDGQSFALEEQGETQQRKNDVLECRVVV